MANPLLYAIGSSLVQRMVGGDVIVYLLIGKLFESDISLNRETHLPLGGSQCDTCDDLMSLATEFAEHPSGLGFVLGLTHHLLTQNDYGVGSDDQFVVRQRVTISQSLLLRDVSGNILGGHV